MKLSTRDRLVWLASGVLMLAWVVGLVANFAYKDLWTADGTAEMVYRQNFSLLVAAAIVLGGAVIAWQFYALGAAELRRQADMDRQHREALEEAYIGTLHALTSALDLRDDETYGHSRRVMGYSLAVGRRLGCSQQDLQTLAWGALLHDLGKIGIRDRILLKPGPLTAEERAQMNQHVVIGWQLVQNVPFLARTAEMVRHHHERFDGTGYPDRLKGQEIPLLARIFAVADAFDAMTSSRPYRREPLLMPQARAVIAAGTGAQFCPQVSGVFCGIPLAELEQIRVDSFRPIDRIDDLVHVQIEPHQRAQSYYRDVLTGTHNRAAWEAKRSQMSLTQGHTVGTILFLDLDGLKRINDTHGHMVGDQVLADLGARLQHISPEVYRMGGDEFLVWAPPGTSGKALEQQATAVLSLFSQDWTHLDCGTAVSWGLAEVASESDTLAELLHEADRRMYARKGAKGPGRASP
jgi:diguanylate cyclase (GGDEF)-like protein/putative nucleotidyltransferase with HDIG domain